MNTSNLIRNTPLTLAIVSPCYNEEEVLPETSSRLMTLFNQLKEEDLIDNNSYVLLVDDGSSDTTWSFIESLVNKEHSIFRGLKLSRNFGHQYALLAGLHQANDTTVVVSIDADLQDDLNAIKAMLLEYRKGSEIVYGVRDDRGSDTFFKRNTALMFYKLLSIMGVESVYNHADFRLMSQRSLEAMKAFGERNIFLRGMIPMIGFTSTSVFYKRDKRFAGSSKYNFKKMLSFAWRGISSLSIKPLRFVTFCGFVVFGISILMAIYALYSYLFLSTTLGWTSIVLPMYFLGGIQLLCIGLIGEYIANIYKEIKQRPLYIIDKFIK